MRPAVAPLQSEIATRRPYRHDLRAADQPEASRDGRRREMGTTNANQIAMATRADVQKDTGAANRRAYVSVSEEERAEQPNSARTRNAGGRGCAGASQG